MFYFNALAECNGIHKHHLGALPPACGLPRGTWDQEEAAKEKAPRMERLFCWFDVLFTEPGPAAYPSSAL
ncbi:hypothetical protein, partial [Leisingera sp. ANG-M6]|uniref:hypothetical protein n=1 Tax=Leisingera sp. ANG-M6 TaxID=1577900 RepID=UPI0019D32DE7